MGFNRWNMFERLKSDPRRVARVTKITVRFLGLATGQIVVVRRIHKRKQVRG